MTICFVCQRMALRNPAKHDDLLENPKSYETEHCVLCARDFCEAHKSKDESVCEINHHTYYFKHQQIPGIFPTLEARNKQNEQSKPGEQ
ncbi:uncharacterized protein N7479_002997 [Penicillium vulpinum]|uniref:uncharacterized protein n=1 Tax=Penicillium vulpinum TaxID=29845 RepID=UPI0025496F99|nr:uncharacterized protein N7479_002997 [Penicillium vulpinum]KAJ5973079.1 hypothetical protein N7479_002997 [Penicillium vulpinum]